MGESLDSWPIRKPSANVSGADEFKIELIRKLLEAQGIDGKITDCNITFTIQPTFNFRKLLRLDIKKITKRSLE